MQLVNNDSNESDSSSDGAGGPKVKEDETVMHKHGMSAMQTLNDSEIFQRYMELIA